MSGGTKPKVLFVNHWASRLGGAEYSLCDLLSWAVERWDCHLATSEDGALVKKAEALGVTCHVVPCSPSVGAIRRWGFAVGVLFSWRQLLSFAAFVFRLRTCVAHVKPSLIHANVPKSHIALFLLCRLGYRGAACIHVREIFARRSAATLVYQLLVPRRCAVIAISHAVRDRLPRALQRRAEVIYNGVHVPAFAGPTAAPGVLRMIYLGRVVPWKGCHELVDIVHIAAAQTQSLRLELDLVGDTAYWAQEYRLRLEAQIRNLGASLCCRMNGHTDDPYAALLAHDVFCSAACEEPFGRSIAEAQACGLAVVAYDSGGVKEIVEHERTGLLVPFGDKTAFAQALLRLADRPELVQELGNRGRERMKKQFNRTVQGPLVCDYLDGCFTARVS